jgi:hypothetical protein
MELGIPRTERCAVCDGPLGTEPYWIVEYPRAIHERCRDWSAEPWPYRGELEGLRKLVRRLRLLTRDAVATGKALAALEREWPKNGARGLATARSLVDDLRGKLSRVGIEWRR